jgi:hypothetical protein
MAEEIAEPGVICGTRPCDLARAWFRPSDDGG